MKNIRKINVFLTLSLILLNFIFVSPSYSLVSREEFEVLKKIVEKQDIIIKELRKKRKVKKAKKL